MAADATTDRDTRRMQALKLTEDGRPATLAELGDLRRDLTKNERIKLEKPGPQVWHDIVDRYAREGFDAITEDDMERFKWCGVYQQKPKTGHFMMRVKIAGGRLHNDQIRVLAGIANDFARGIADITTRQTLQMHWLTIDQFPEIMDRLGTVGLGVHHGLFGACGDICRNVVSSPIAGLDPAELLDPSDLFLEVSHYFSAHPRYADMPRKFKIGIFGHRGGGQCEINCLALYGGDRGPGGTVGYGLMIGGGLSTEPYLARDLGVWVAPDRAFAVVEAVARIYRDHGYRKSRKHARLKYLMADWGVEKFRAKIEEIVGYRLADAAAVPDDVPGYQDQLGVHAQRQPGLSFIGVPVLAGRITSDQLAGAGAIAAEFGSGDIRLTVMQSFYLVNIPHQHVPAVLQRLEAIGLPVEASAIRRGVVACTGIEFCNLAVTETKERAKNIVNLLDNGVKWTDSEFFRINVNGCPNSCGQHWIADVGLQGCTTKKIDVELVEHFDIFLGGTLGTDARFNRRIKRLPAEEVAPAVQTLIERFKVDRQGHESFADFVRRHTDQELEVMF